MVGNVFGFGCLGEEVEEEEGEGRQEFSLVGDSLQMRCYELLLRLKPLGTGKSSRSS